jgi:hypothetical protein
MPDQQVLSTTSDPQLLEAAGLVLLSSVSADPSSKLQEYDGQ